MSNSDSQNDKDKAEIEIAIEPEIEKQPENEIEIETELETKAKTETEVAESGEPVEEIQSDVDVSQDLAVEDAPSEVDVTQDEPVEESSDVSVLPIEDNQPSTDADDTESDTENKSAEKFIEAFKSDKETFAQKLKKIHENLASKSEPKKFVDDAGILKIAVTLAVITAVTVFMLAILNSITSPVIQERLINETSFGDDIIAVESDGELE